jgi:fructoselysine-6-P-deglycase FrlB-like protein
MTTVRDIRGMLDGAHLDAFLADIHRQPFALARIAETFTGEERQTLAAVRRWFWKGEHHLIVFAGTAESLFAAQAIIPTLNRIGIRAVAIDISELLYFGIPSLAGKVAVVLVSASGEGPELRAFMKAVKGRVGVLGIVCNPDSFLAMTADLVVRVPVEDSSAVGVLSYTGTIAVLRLLSHVLAGGVVDQVAHSLNLVTESLSRYLEGRTAVAALAGCIQPGSAVYLAGRGSSSASAHEGGLLFNTVAHRQAQSVPASDLYGGTRWLAGPSPAVVLFAPQGPAFEAQRQLANELASRHARLVVLTDGKTSGFPGAEVLIRLEYPDDAMAPLVEIAPIQLAVHAMSSQRLSLASDSDGSTGQA